MGRRFLILTAGYGEGHNSAARALKEQGELRGYDCYVHDVCREAMPRTFAWTKAAYLHIIAHWPWVWRCLFDLADSMEAADRTPMCLARIRNRLLELVDTLQPEAVICTFPLYGLMLDDERLHGSRALPPYVVVITDSLAVSRSWLSSRPDLWLVSDERTRERLLSTYAMAPSRMGVSGFPVSGRFAPSPAVSSWAEGEPFRILYVPQAPFHIVKKELAAMLAAHPDVLPTVVTGSKKGLYDRLVALFGKGAGADPEGRVSVSGWVDTMPELMATHHLYVGKAGGASTHECYAACLPMIVNFFVPGQEEGNLELLLAEGCGRVCETPEDLGRILSLLLRSGGGGWRAMKSAMSAVERREGAQRCWQMIENVFLR